ncbi:MAG: hypothetical protein RI884_1157 [Pseudomonadota bacterium]|jgi:hypothetical protein
MKDTGPPRFVPILTEVVQDPPAGGAIDLAAVEAQLVARVRARLLAELEPLLLESLRSVQAQQAAALEAGVRAELATRLARLVDEALAPPPQD